MFSKYFMLLLLVIQFGNGFACSMSTVVYKAIKESDWDRRPLAQALRKDFSIRKIHSGRDINLSVVGYGETSKSRAHIVEGSALRFQSQYPVLAKNESYRNVYFYIEAYRRSKLKRGTAKIFVGRFLLWKIKDPDPAIKYNKFSMIGFSSHFRLVAVFERFNKITRRTVFSAYLSDFYTNGMSHCGGVFPILLRNFNKYCSVEDQNDGICWVI